MPREGEGESMSAVIVTYPDGNLEHATIGAHFVGQSILRAEIHVTAATYVSEEFRRWMHHDILTRLERTGRVVLEITLT